MTAYSECNRAVMLGIAIWATMIPALAQAALTEEDAEKLQEAQTAYDGKKYLEALEILQPLEERYPTEGEIPRLTAHVFYELEKYSEARKSALRAIANGRVTADLLARLVQIDQRSDDDLAAVNTVRLLTVIDKDNSTWRMMYGGLLGEVESLEESAGVYRKLLEAHPDSVELQLRLGNTLVQLGENEEAVAVLETAWHLGEPDPRVATLLAGVWQREGNQRQSLSWSKRAADLGNGSDETLQLQVARLQWDLGLTQQARSTAGELVDSADQDVKAKSLVLLGQIAMRSNELDLAMEHWRKAIAAGAEARQLLIAVGAHHFNQGEYAAAAATLKRVLAASGQTLQESDHQPLRFLTISLIRVGNHEEARDYLRQFVELHGLNDEAKQLVKIWASSEAE